MPAPSIQQCIAETADQVRDHGFFELESNNFLQVNCDLGQALWPDHDQQHDADHDEFRKTEVEHVCSLETRRTVKVPL